MGRAPLTLPFQGLVTLSNIYIYSNVSEFSMSHCYIPSLKKTISRQMYNELIAYKNASINIALLLL